MTEEKIVGVAIQRHDNHLLPNPGKHAEQGGYHIRLLNKEYLKILCHSFTTNMLLVMNYDLAG